MPRIRNIKPETFDDPDLNALPALARWVFVGLWTQADRDGRLEDDPRRLKARLLPYDRADMDVLLTELAPKFITRYAVNGRNYLQVNNFTKHQRFHKDEKSTGFPPPPTNPSGQPGNFPAKRTESGDLEAGSTEAGETEVRPSAVVPPVVPLVDMWNTTVESPIRACLEVTPKRQRHIAVRSRERDEAGWSDVIRRINASKFCRGGNDRGWVATFDWLIGSADVAVKVLEGKYDDREVTATKATTATIQARNQAEMSAWLGRTGSGSV